MKKSGKPRGDEQARETRKKKTHIEEEVGRYRSSSVTPVSQPNFLALERGSRTQYLHPCRELVTLFLTIKRQPTAKFLNAGLLLLSNASFC